MLLIDKIVKLLKKEKREKMMVDMMPAMMDGIDMNKLLPKMLTELLKDLSTDDVIKFLEDLFNENESFSKLGSKLAEANLMPKLMMKKWMSNLPFEETVATIKRNAPNFGWHIPDTRDLQKVWKDNGFNDAGKTEVIYFCNPQGGYEINKDDENKVMSVMMPMGVSVYETSKGKVEVAAMNIGMMSHMFTGKVNEVLSQRAIDLENSIKVVTV